MLHPIVTVKTGSEHLFFFQRAASQHHIVSKSSSVWPPKGSWHHNLYRGGWVSRCVCILASVCSHAWIRSSILCVLILICISLLVFFLFVCLLCFPILILFSTALASKVGCFDFLPRRQHYKDGVGIRIRRRTVQCKCKPTKSSYGSLYSPQEPSEGFFF